MPRPISHSPQETAKIAQQIWADIQSFLGQKAIIIALGGELGSGKTTFTKALAHTMGIKDLVVSPTFTLHEEYDHFDHIDAWRVEDPSEIIALGLEKMIENKRVIVIEWAEKIKKEIDKFRSQAMIIWIKFEYGRAVSERLVSWHDLK